MLSLTRTTSIMKYDLVYCRVLAVSYKTTIQSFCLPVLFYFLKRRERARKQTSSSLFFFFFFCASLSSKCVKSVMYAAARCRRRTTTNTSLLPPVVFIVGIFFFFHFFSFFLTTWSEHTCQKRNIYIHVGVKKIRVFFFGLLERRNYPGVSFSSLRIR